LKRSDNQRKYTVWTGYSR